MSHDLKQQTSGLLSSQNICLNTLRKSLNLMLMPLDTYINKRDHQRDGEL